MLKKNQDGFLHLYYLLALVTIAAIIFVGFKVIGKHNSLSSVTQSSNTTCSPPGTPTCDLNGHPIKDQAVSQNSSTGIQALNVKYSNIQLTGAGPQGLDIDQATNNVYVVNNGTTVGACQGATAPPPNPSAQAPGANTMSIVSLSSMKELSNTPTVDGPVWPFVDSQRGVVYVGGSANGEVGVYNATTGQLETEINVGGRPHAFGLHNNILIVSNTGDNTETHMSVINADTRQVISTQSSPALPHGIVYDSTRNVFYMVGVKNGDIAVIDANTGKIESTFQALTGSGNSNMLAFSQKARKLFVSDKQSGSAITVVNPDTGKKIGTINFDTNLATAWGMQVDDNTGLLYVALPDANAIGVVDVNTLKPLGLISVDSCPYAVRLDTSLGVGVSTSQTHSTLSVFKLADVKKVLGR